MPQICLTFVWLGVPGSVCVCVLSANIAKLLWQRKLLRAFHSKCCNKHRKPSECQAGYGHGPSSCVDPAVRNVVHGLASMLCATEQHRAVIQARSQWEQSTRRKRTINCLFMAQLLAIRNTLFLLFLINSKRFGKSL